MTYFSSRLDEIEEKLDSAITTAKEKCTSQTTAYTGKPVEATWSDRACCFINDLKRYEVLIQRFLFHERFYRADPVGATYRIRGDVLLCLQHLESARMRMESAKTRMDQYLAQTHKESSCNENQDKDY